MYKSEIAKVRHLIMPYCLCNSVIDYGFGGDKICPWAIGIDLEKPYANTGGDAIQLVNEDNDSANLPWFKDESIDVIVSSHLLEDFDNKIEVMKEWTRVLKVGGHLALYLPDEQCYRKYCFLHNQGSNTAHKDENFSKEKLKKYAEQLGNLKVMLETDIIMDYSFAIVFRKTKAIVGE